jgi:hypothetical protein
VVLAGLVMLMADDAPDVLPEVWANAGVETNRTANAIHIRMAQDSELRIYQGKLCHFRFFNDDQNIKSLKLEQLLRLLRLVNRTARGLLWAFRASTNRVRFGLTV